MHTRSRCRHLYFFYWASVQLEFNEISFDRWPLRIDVIRIVFFSHIVMFLTILRIQPGQIFMQQIILIILYIGFVP